MASIAFSPNSMQLLKAESSQLSLDFNTDSKLQVYDVRGGHLRLQEERQFSVSFSCCDWGDNGYLVAGTESGQLLLCQEQGLGGAELQQLSGSKIAAARWSAVSEKLVAVGTTAGEVLFVGEDKQVFYEARTNNNEYPHKAAVCAVRWNTRVPRVCCSLDEGGTLIVWDTKKRGAVMHFETGCGGIDCCFSESVATVVFALTAQQTVEVWDLRERNKKLAQLQLRPGARALRFAEGTENVLGVYYVDGTVDSYDVSDLGHSEPVPLVGSQRLGQLFSYAYPNVWASLDEHNLTVNLRCPIIRGVPLLFDPRIMDNALGDDEPELLQITRRPICFGTRNILRTIAAGTLTQCQVSDCPEVVDQVRDVLSGADNTIDDVGRQFFQLFSREKKEVFAELLGTAEQSIVTDTDFFNQSLSGSAHDAGAQDPNQLGVEIEDRLLVDLMNGRVPKVLDELVKHKNFATAFYLMLRFRYPAQECQKYLDQYGVNAAGEEGQYTSPKAVVDQIANRRFDLAQCRRWQDYILMVQAYDQQRLGEAIQEPEGPGPGRAAPGPADAAAEAQLGAVGDRAQPALQAGRRGEGCADHCGPGRGGAPRGVLPGLPREKARCGGARLQARARAGAQAAGPRAAALPAGRGRPRGGARHRPLLQHRGAGARTGPAGPAGRGAERRPDVRGRPLRLQEPAARAARAGAGPPPGAAGGAVHAGAHDHGPRPAAGGRAGRRAPGRRDGPADDGADEGGRQTAARAAAQHGPEGRRAPRPGPAQDAAEPAVPAARAAVPAEGQLRLQQERRQADGTRHVPGRLRGSPRAHQPRVHGGSGPDHPAVPARAVQGGPEHRVGVQQEQQ